MKIISKGNKNVQCKQCGCIAQYESDDIKKKIIDVRTSNFLNYIESWKITYIDCPNCGYEIEIYAKCLG